MTTIINAVNSKQHIITSEFLKLTIYNPDNSTTIHTFSTSYKPETIDGQEYLALGGLLSIGSQQRDIRATSSDTIISLSGLTSDSIYLVLGTQIKGSLLQITRGFYDDNYNLTQTVPRFNGLVTSYSIGEDYQDNTDNFTISINCSSLKLVLENKISGRKTNSTSWRLFFSDDASMDKVAALDGAYFDFGKPVTSSGGDSSASTTVTATVTPR